MKHVVVLVVGFFALTMASGCCGWGWHNGPGNSCGAGGYGVQPYGQPIPNGAYYSPVPTQQAYAPLPPIPDTIGLPVQSLPTYY